MNTHVQWKYQLSDIDFGEEEQQAVLSVLQSKWLSMGEQTQRFEEEISQYVGARAVAVSSGTAALHLALRAIDIKPGDEVIVPSYTFIATVNCIRYQGATPVFIDINGPHDLNLDTSQLPDLLTERTRAVLPVHIAGYATQLEDVVRFAREHGLWVVEDAAHAIGSSYHNTPLGTYGDIGCYSFFANKNLVTGEGGMLVTHNDTIFERTRPLRSHGMHKTSWEKAQGASLSYDVSELGYNYRMTELQAALGLCQLAKLERNNIRRQQLADHYRKQLSQVPEITIPFLNNPTCGNNHLFPIVLDPGINREAVIARLKARSVQTSIHYPPVHMFSLYAGIGASLARTEDVSSREITLPLHPLLTETDIDDICTMLCEALTHCPKKDG